MLVQGSFFLSDTDVSMVKDLATEIFLFPLVKATNVRNIYILISIFTSYKQWTVDMEQTSLETFLTVKQI